jgi:hypothetical protein
MHSGYIMSFEQFIVAGAYGIMRYIKFKFLKKVIAYDHNSDREKQG